MSIKLVNKEQLRQYYHRFSHWQQAEPHYVNRHQDIVQHCHNCDTDYCGNFCPICGQRAGLGRVGWQSIKDNMGHGLAVAGLHAGATAGASRLSGARLHQRPSPGIVPARQDAGHRLSQ